MSTLFITVVIVALVVSVFGLIALVRIVKNYNPDNSKGD